MSLRYANPNMPPTAVQALAALALLASTALAQDHKLYNTAKQKLAAG